MKTLDKLKEKRDIKKLAKALETPEMAKFLEEKRKKTNKKIPKKIKDKRTKDFLLYLKNNDYKELDFLKEMFKEDLKKL